MAHRTAENREALGVTIILAGVGFLILRVSLIAIPLGYDETVYASKTRSYVTDIAAFWPIWRPPGLPIVGLAAVPFGLSDASLRLVAGATGLLTLGLAWSLARLLWGGLAAAIALVAIVASPVVLDQIILFHNDVASAAPVLALMALLWWQLEERERPNLLLVAAGPLAAASFYLRYGVLALLAGIALATVLLWSRRLLREPRLVGATVLVTVGLFLPHLITAVVMTGSPFGIVRAAVALTDTMTPWQSALQYLRWLRAHLVGVLGVSLFIAAGLGALHATVGSIRQRHSTAAARRLIWLLVPATVAVVGTVVVSHPEPRYILTPLILALIAGAGSAAAAATWLRLRLARREPRAAGAIVPAILVLLLIVLAVEGRSWIRVQLRQTPDRWLQDAGQVIAADAGGSCTVTSSIGPILGWYSGCSPIAFIDRADIRTAVGGPGPAYVVFTTLDAGRGVGTDVLASYRNDLNLVEIATFGRGQRIVKVYRVQP